MSFDDRLRLQYDKQHMHGETFPVDDAADYFRTNAFALTDEIHEAAKEIGWKPWATTRHFNRNQFLGELADAQLFLDNLILLALNSSQSPEDLQAEFDRLILEKIQRSVRRQQENYDGVTSKCQCGRDAEDGSWISVATIEGMITDEYECPCGQTNYIVVGRSDA